jgi:rhodanese-related sulfurtransferase
MSRTPSLALLTLIATLVTACTPSEKPAILLEPPTVDLPANYRLIAPAAARDLIASNPRLQLIDCRMEEEFVKSRLPGAHHANYFEPEQMRERMAALDPNRPCLIYCALGHRARSSALVLHELGFAEVSILDGGLTAWLKAGLPLTAATE